jgi:SAM-dependent methyltransferase
MMWELYWEKIEYSPIEKLIEWWKIKYGYKKFLPLFAPLTVGSSLEVGCGRAALSSLLTKKGWFTTGVDTLAPRVCGAQRFVLGSAFGLYFSAKEFDLAFSCGLLEHLTLKEGLQHIQEMKRVARKVVVIYPSSNWVWKMLWLIRGIPQGKCTFKPTGRIKFFGVFTFNYIIC